MTENAKSKSPLYKPISDDQNSSEEKRLFSPASQRNKQVILETLKNHAPSRGDTLEIACGSGEHAIHFAAAFPNLNWQPTDIEPSHIESVNAHASAEGINNLKPAIHLNVTQKDWSVGKVDLIFNANMIHISPWQCTLGLMAGAGRHLKSGGILFMYGPYMKEGQHTAPSNASFDATLRSRDENWGIRAIEDVVAIAEQHQLSLHDLIPMPANNFCVIYKKT